MEAVWWKSDGSNNTIVSQSISIAAKSTLRHVQRDIVPLISSAADMWCRVLCVSHIYCCINLVLMVPHAGSWPNGS